jgi:hypothetical protein
VYAVTVLPAAKSGCPVPFTDHRVTIAPTNEVAYRYTLRRRRSLVLVAPRGVPRGMYHLHVGVANQVSVTAWGITAGSVALEHMSSDGRLVAQRTVPTSGVARVTSSSLQFTSVVPGTRTGFTVSVCTREALSPGDVVNVGLQSFTSGNVGQQFSFMTNSSGLTYGAAAGSVNRNVLVSYSWATQTLALAIQGHPGHCISVRVRPTLYALKLPATAIFENSPAFTLGITSNNSNTLQNEVFQQVTPVGIASVSLDFGTPIPGFNTSVTVTFTLLTDFQPNAGNSSIFLNLPGFYLNSTAIALQTEIEQFAKVQPNEVRCLPRPTSHSPTLLRLSPHSSLPCRRCISSARRR